MALKQTQLKGRDVGDGSIGRADLNVSLAGEAVIRKMIDVANSGVKISSYTGVDPGTGDVGMALDWTLLGNTYSGINHTHAYLPLIGGTLTGNLNILKNDGNPVGASLYNTNATGSSRLFIGAAITETTFGALFQYDNSANSLLILNRKATTGTVEVKTTGGGLSIANTGAATFTGSVTAPSFIGVATDALNLGGIVPSYYSFHVLTSPNIDDNTTNLNGYSSGKGYQSATGTFPVGLETYSLMVNLPGHSATNQQLAWNTSGEMYTRIRYGGTTFLGWRKFWDESNLNRSDVAFAASTGTFSGSVTATGLQINGSGANTTTWVTNDNWSVGNTVTLRLGNYHPTYKNFSPYIRSTVGGGINQYSLSFGTGWSTDAEAIDRLVLNQFGATVIGTVTAAGFTSTSFSSGVSVINPAGSYARLSSLSIANAVHHAVLSVNGIVNPNNNGWIQDNVNVTSWMIVLNATDDVFQIKRGAAGVTSSNSMFEKFTLSNDGSGWFGGSVSATIGNFKVPINSTEKIAGTNAGAGLSLLSANGLYGLFGGVSSAGHVWLQVGRNDGFTDLYPLNIQALGGATNFGGPTNSTGLLTGLSGVTSYGTLDMTFKDIIRGGNATFTNTVTANHVVVNSAYDGIYTQIALCNPMPATATSGKGVAITLGHTEGSYYSKIATVFESQNPDYLRPALVFYTMGSSYLAGSEIERMRIHSDGNINMTQGLSVANIITTGSGSYSYMTLDASGILPKVIFGTQGSYIGYDYTDNERMVLNSRYYASHYEFQIAGVTKFNLAYNGDATFSGSVAAVGSGTFAGGGFNSQRSIKNIHKDWGGNALNVISKFKIRDFNYKTRPDYDRTLGFIIDEIPKEIGDYALSGEERNSVNTYTLHGLSFKGLQEVKTKLDVQSGELDWQSEKIILLEKRIMELEGRLN